MAYQYLLKRFLPFSLGFLAAVFVTSFFQVVGSIGATPNVPEVTATSYGRPYSCRTKFGGHASHQDSSLKVLHKPAPQYTAAARENGTEGTVILRVTFLENGEVGQITPVRELGDGLTERAIEAAREMSFKPAMRNGTPVSSTKMVEYTFSME